MRTPANHAAQKKRDSTIQLRVAERDKTAVQDGPDAYGNFIWALAKKITSSAEEAEAAAQEIFTDIWRFSKRIDKTPTAEKKLIALIALRRLIKQLEQIQIDDGS